MSAIFNSQAPFTLHEIGFHRVSKHAMHSSDPLRELNFPKYEAYRSSDMGDGICTPVSWNFIRPLAETRMSDVLLVERTTDNKRFVFKQVKELEQTPIGPCQMVRHEAGILLRLQTSAYSYFFPKPEGLTGEDQFDTLIMHKTPGIRAEQYAQGFPNESLPRFLLNFTYQMLSAMKAMSQRHITHRDIKPDNIFVSQPSNDEASPHFSEQLRIKIIDFGFAACEGWEDPFAEGVGSPTYICPEAIQKFETLGFPRDCYGLGGTIVNLATGEHLVPTRNNEPERKYVVRSIFSKLSTDFLKDRLTDLGFTKPWRSFLYKLLHPEIHKRPQSPDEAKEYLDRVSKNLTQG